MAGQTKRTRTNQRRGSAQSAPARPRTLRERKPIVYWVAVIAVLMLILSTFAGIAASVL